MTNRKSNRKISAARLMQTQAWNILIASTALVSVGSQVWLWINSSDWRYVGFLLAAIATLVALFYFWTLWLQDRLSSRADEKREEIANYLIQMPSSGDESFYLGWVFNLSQKGRSPDRQATVYITAEFAEKSFVGVGDQGKGRALQRLEELRGMGRKIFDGVFVIVANPDDEATKNMLLRYHRVFDGNLVLLDMNMDRNRGKDRGYPALDFIGSDEEVGGGRAARLAFDYLTKILYPGDSKDFVFNVLILEAHDKVVADGMTSREYMWDQKRVVSFRNNLMASLNSVKYRVNFVTLGGTHYNQIRAKEVLKMSLGKQDFPWLSKFDLIFCVNDDVALGAAQTLEEMFNDKDFLIQPESDSNEQHPRRKLYQHIRKLHNGFEQRETEDFKYEAFEHMGPRVIGYDRSKDFEREARDGNEWLIGTVDVYQEEQAESALRVMEELRSSGSFRKARSGKSSSAWMNRRFGPKVEKSTPNDEATEGALTATEAGDDGNSLKNLGRNTYWIEPDVCISPILKPLLIANNINEPYIVI